MTTNAKSDTCQSCGKGWSTHHTLAAVIADKAHIQCHTDGIPDTLEYKLRAEMLIIYLNGRAGRKAVEAKLLDFQQQVELDKQAAEAELKRKFDSKVETEANKKLADALTEVETEHQQAIENMEATRVQLMSSHDAKVLDLTAQLRAAEGSNRLLLQEKTDLEAKLAESQGKSIELQIENDGLNASLDDLKARHKGLKDRSLEIVRTLISVGTRVAVLEEKLDIVPKVDPKRIFKMVLGEDFDDDVIPVEQLRNDPTPVPAPAPKAEVETKAPVNGTKVQPPTAPAAPKPQMVVLDDSAPAAPASADDADDDHDVGDDDVVAEHDADADDASDEEECSVCDKKAGHVLVFTAKSGAQERLTSCLPNAHGKEFLKHLQATAKGAPKSVSDIALLFEDIHA